MRKMNRLVGLAATAAVTFLAPARGLAQEEEDFRALLSAYLRTGFGGEVDGFAEGDGVDVHTSADLQPSVGFGLRGEARVLDFLSVGGFFEATTFEPEPLRAGPFEVEFDREWMFDIDAFVKGRWLFEVVRNDFWLEPYLLLPIGFTVGAFNSPVDPDDDRGWPGWNTGVMTGLTMLSRSGWGGFFEIGWRHHEVYTSETSDLVIARTHVDYAYVFNQFAMNLGVSYALR